MTDPERAVIPDAWVEAARIAFQDRGLENHRSTDERMRAALSVVLPLMAGRVTVEVKPLEWIELTEDRGDGTREPNGNHEAQTPFGFYEIEMIEGSSPTVWRVTFGIEGDYIGCDYLSPAAAQAAAQADYKSCIRSTLVPAPDAGKAEGNAAVAGVAEVVEASAPFSALAGEIFSRNWNASDTVVAIYPRPNRPDDRDVRLTAGDFYRLRMALTALPPANGEGR